MGILLTFPSRLQLGERHTHINSQHHFPILSFHKDKGTNQKEEMKQPNAPKRPRICAQYATDPHTFSSTRDETGLFTMLAPTTQNSHVMKTQIAWAPTDATGCLDHAGWRKSRVYAPAVRDVHVDVNLECPGVGVGGVEGEHE